MTVTNPPVNFVQPFTEGDIPSGNKIVLLENDGVTQITNFQQDQESYWPDGSYKSVCLSFISPDTFAASQNIGYKIGYQSGTPDRTGFLTIAQLTAATDFKYQLTGIDFGTDVWQVSVNDVLTNGTAFPWGSNPVHGYEVIRSGPVCCEWHCWGLAKRVSDSAYHKWVYIDIWVRAWNLSGGTAYEIGGRVRQSNIFGPHPSGTVGADPQTKYVFIATLLNSSTTLYTWGGPNDVRVISYDAATDVSTSSGTITLNANSMITQGQWGVGVAFQFSGGTPPAPCVTGTTYWLTSNIEDADGQTNTCNVATTRMNAINTANGQSFITFTSTGSGTVSIIPYMQCYPFCATLLMGVDGNRIWTGSLTSQPTVLVGKDFNYLTQKTRAVPPYLPNVTNTLLTNTTAAYFCSGAFGTPFDTEETGVEANEERLGYMNRTQVISLYNPFDQYLDRKSKAYALQFGEQHTYIVNEQTGMIPNMTSLSTYTNLGTPQGAIRSYPYQPANWAAPSQAAIDQDGIPIGTGTWMPNSHSPCPWVGPYLSCGDIIYWDCGLHLTNQQICQLYYSQITLNSVDYWRVHAYNYMDGVNDYSNNELRGVAWGSRCKFEAMFYMPSNHPAHDYWDKLCQDEANYYTAFMNYQAGPNYTTMGCFDQQSSGTAPNSQPFEDYYLGTVLGMLAWRNEYTAINTFVTTYYHKWFVGMVDSASGGCISCAGIHFLYPWTGNPTNPADSQLPTTWDGIYNNTTTQWPSSGVPPNPFPNPFTCPGISTVYQQNGEGGHNDPDSDLSWHMAAIAMAAVLGVANASSIYTTLRNYQYGLNPPLSFNDQPTWGIGPLGATS